MNKGLDAPKAGSSKNTVYVAGFPAEVKEQELLDAFVTFGDILEISLPAEPNDSSKHRGFAFLTFSNPADAQEAIDNYDLNELPTHRGQGKYLKCSIAQPNRFGNEGGKGDKFDRPVWESEEWLQKYAKTDGAEGGGGEGNGEPAEIAEDEL